MISAVAEMYGIHPQTLRLYEREGLSSRPEPKAILASIPTKTSTPGIYFVSGPGLRSKHFWHGNHPANARANGGDAAADSGLRKYIQEEVLARASAATDASKGAIVPMRRPYMAPAAVTKTKKDKEIGDAGMRRVHAASNFKERL